MIQFYYGDGRHICWLLGREDSLPALWRLIMSVEVLIFLAILVLLAVKTYMDVYWKDDDK